MKFSVVVATWNEGAQIGSYLKRLRQVSQSSPMEIIVVDGHSSDDTAEVARNWADHVIVLDAPNRGAQLDAGAKKASGDLLFFLRPDAQPPANWEQALEHFWLANHPKKVAASVFTIDYGSSLWFRLAARATNFLVGWRGLATGDHGLCTTPEIYRQSGGYPAFAYREDLTFCERLSKFGEIVMLPDRIWPAARRLLQKGPVACAMQSAWLELRYKLGAKPDDLWRVYSGA